MNKNLKRGLVLAAGFIFLVLGFIGLALPFLQGFLFIAIGLVLLSIASPTVRAWVEHYTRKFPKIHGFVEKVVKRITDVIGTP